MANYVVSVFGSGGVGKSCFTLQFVQGIFMTKYDPTIEDVYKRIIEVDEKKYGLEIFDTAGTDGFSSMRDFYIRDSHGFLLVYSITSKASFNEINAYYDQIMDIKNITNDGVPAIVLIGNKTDLEEQRVVSREDGQALARKWNCTFLETSAKDRSNVIESFYDLVRQINRKSQISRSNKSPSENHEQSEACVSIQREPSTASSNARSANKASGCCFLF